jgi:hypothetical protein
MVKITLHPSTNTLLETENQLQQDFRDRRKQGAIKMHIKFGKLMEAPLLEE